MIIEYSIVIIASQQCKTNKCDISIDMIKNIVDRLEPYKLYAIVNIYKFNNKS